MGAGTYGELTVTGISQTFSHQFSNLFINRRNNLQMSRNLHCLPKQCSLETDQKSRTQQDRRVIGCIHMYLLYTLDFLSVIYIFEEKKKAFLSSFFHAFIIFCSSCPHPPYRLSVRLRQINSCSALAS